MQRDRLQSRATSVESDFSRRDPVKAFSEHQTLRHVETERVNFGDRHQESGELLAVPEGADLSCLFDRVDRVLAGAREDDDFRAQLWACHKK